MVFQFGSKYFKPSYFYYSFKKSKGKQEHLIDRAEVLVMGKTSTPATEYIEAFLILIFVVPALVGIIRIVSSDVDGVEGNLINVIADVLSPEVSIILLAVSVFSYFTVKMLKSRE